MRWPTFLTRRTAATSEQLRSTIAAQIDEALARRKAGRAQRRARAEKGAATKARQQLSRDPLFNEQVVF